MTNKPAKPDAVPSRYSITGMLAAAHKRHMKDPDPLDPTEDLILLRAVIDLQVSKLEAGEDDNSTLLEQLDLVTGNIAQLVKLSDTIHARRNQYKVTPEQLNIVAEQMADVVQQHVDPDTFSKILDGWSKIKRPQ